MSQETEINTLGYIDTWMSAISLVRIKIGGKI
jgi:hypothetical protein